MRQAVWIIFAILSIICGSTEAFELLAGTEITWSDHLHNFLDHINIILINYIGFKLYTRNEQ